MQKVLRIGTRDSQLAVWQATLVQDLLKQSGVASELVYMKSEGDIDTVTPLYALGVTGVFTKTLDAALLNGRIDIAVHSMKDVPVQLAQGIRQAAVLKRASHKDLLVPHPDLKDVDGIFRMGLVEEVQITCSNIGDTSTSTFINTGEPVEAIVATSSIRRIAQWKGRYPHHTIVNLRGNVNTRLKKLRESNWSGAIFAAAGLERINLRPENAIELDWMLPAPAQGAIMIACRIDDDYAFECCKSYDHAETALCAKIERDFLSTLMGGCSTPISALAQVVNGNVILKCSVDDPDGLEGGGYSEHSRAIVDAIDLGITAGKRMLTMPTVVEVINRLSKKGLSADGKL